MSNTPLRLGTRDSALALWQAHKVQALLKDQEIDVEVVPIKSEGDLKLDKPLYELGITGIFTRSLDLALLDGRIDFAVHSLKDVPTALAHGLEMWSILERADHRDVLLHKGLNFLDDSSHSGTIATGSLRRQAQWLHRYPHHRVTNLRGNVQTRLQKLRENDWNGAIFAYAGLERMELLPEDVLVLDWMIPAPAQGAIAVVGRQTDPQSAALLKQINHAPTQFCVEAERHLLQVLEGGCTAPIGAFAYLENETITLQAGLFALDGSTGIIREGQSPVKERLILAEKLANEIREQGGEPILKSLRNA